MCLQDDQHGTVDLGGAYVGPTQNRVFRLCKELGLQLYNVYDEQKSIADLKVRQIYKIPSSIYVCACE